MEEEIVAAIAVRHANTRPTGPRLQKMKRIFTKIVDVKPDEIHALWLAFLFNFMVLGGYYVIRPIRDEIGASSGVENLPWMFTAHIVRDARRERALICNRHAHVAAEIHSDRVPVFHRQPAHFFRPHALDATAKDQVWLGRTFFVWLSVINLFVVTVFWAFMTDLFSSEQGKRLFGFIASAARWRQSSAELSRASLVEPIGAANLFLISAADV